MGKISHWICQVSLSVPKSFLMQSRKEELATCLLIFSVCQYYGNQANWLVLSLWIISYSSFSPREEQLMLTCECFFFFSWIRIASMSYLYSLYCFLCARCSWWRQWETWPKEAIIFLLLNFGPSVLLPPLILWKFVNFCSSLFKFIIGSNLFLTF